MIETLQSLAWTPCPAPPIGVAPWLRKKHWFRWFIVHNFLYQIWRLRKWQWVRRTGGGRQDWCW